MPQVYDYDIIYDGKAGATVRRWLWLPGDSDTSLEAARMRIEVLQTYGALPLELFVWERHIVYQSGVGENKDRLVCLAKIADLSVYPVDDPDTNSATPPFYRTSFLDVPFSSPLDAIQTWEALQKEIYSLAEAWVKLDYYSAYPEVHTYQVTELPSPDPSLMGRIYWVRPKAGDPPEGTYWITDGVKWIQTLGKYTMRISDLADWPTQVTAENVAQLEGAIAPPLQQQINAIVTDTMQLTAAESIIIFKIVGTNSSGQALLASSDNTAFANGIAGIAVTSASAGEIVNIKPEGPLTDLGWDWIPGRSIYCGLGGDMTQTPPTTGFLQQVARAVSPTKIVVDIDPAIIRS